MKYTILFLVVINSFLLVSCFGLRNSQYTIQQGVFGQVVWVQGNMMPSPDSPTRGNGNPVQRTIKIYAQTTANQVNGEAPLYTKINTKLIKTVKSDRNGNYQAKLLPGKYSLFVVEEDGKLFANSFDAEGLIAAIEVKANEVATFNIKINYKAYY